jgi:hypothetical protein
MRTIEESANDCEQEDSARPEQSALAESGPVRSWWIPGFAPLLILGIIVYGAIWALAPVMSVVPVDATAAKALIRYNVLLMVGIVIGTMIFRATRAEDSARWSSEPQLSSFHLLNTIFTVASAGVVLRLMDRFVLRPELIGGNIDTIGANSTAIGALASLLYPVGIAALPLSMAMRVPMGRLRLATCHFLFFFPAIDVFLVGKRGVAVTLVVMYIALLLSARRTALLRTVLRIVGLLALASYAFALVFARRIQAYGFDLCHSLYNSQYAYTVKPAGLAARSCQEAHWWDTPMQFATNFAMYILHGSHEFALALPTYFSQASWTWGGTTFDVLRKPLCMFSDSTSCNATAISQTRTGVYTTFWGPFVQDFGPWTEVACLVLGLALALLHRQARASFAWFPLYLYFAAVVVLSPVVNLIQSGLGVYIIVGGLIFAVLYRRQERAGREDRVR